MKPFELRYEDRFFLGTVLAGVLAWVVDAFVDAVVFGENAFLDSLLLDISPHELYFRLFILICFVIFGAIVSVNLSRRRQAEEELRQAIVHLEDEKARSEAVIAAIPDGISIQDREFRVLYQNDVHRAMVGDQLGNLCYEKYARLDSVCPGCPVARSFADGGRHVLEKSRETADGTMYFEISSAPLRNARGEIVAGIEAVRDITERKRNEESLRLFSQAMDEAVDGIQLVDLRGTVLYSNRAVEEIYGFRAEDLRGKHVGEMNVDPQFAGKVVLPSIKEQGRWSGEVAVRHKSGRAFPVWLSTSLVKNDRGEAVAMVGIIRDMTERRRVEDELRRHRERLSELVDERTSELRETNERLRREIIERQRIESDLARVQKLESLGMLAGGIAHDFNNLLGAILGNLSLAMLDVDPSSRAFEQLAKADQASLRAQELTQQLLTFSRGGAPVKRPVALPSVITEAAGFSLRGSRVLHELDLPQDLWPIDADEGQMMQVFNNLLINADQAMPRGGIIRITGKNITLSENEIPTLAAGRYVRISVRDEGTGIPQEHLDRIFDPYFTTKQKGSGLGLAATYSIVRRHDGHVTVRSELGAGTTFHIYLPASDGTVVQRPRGEKAILGSGRVLVMDDERDMRETTGTMLVRLGYEVDFANDGAEAIERYRAARDAGAPFDAVIVDLSVPGGMGGVEAVKKIREFDPQVRAVVSSGYSHDPVVADCRAYGFSDAVIKPYRIRELSEVMARVLGRKQSPQEGGTGVHQEPR